MKNIIWISLIGVFISVICIIEPARAVIKVGIAGDLSGSALTAGEQQEIGALKAIDHLNDNGIGFFLNIADVLLIHGSRYLPVF